MKAVEALALKKQDFARRTIALINGIRSDYPDIQIPGIAYELNRVGALTARGRPWSPRLVRDFLRNNDQPPAS